MRGVFNALSIKISLYDFFQVHLPREENGWEKRFMEIGTWTTSSHKIPSYVGDDSQGTYLGRDNSGITSLCNEVTIQELHFPDEQTMADPPSLLLHLCPNYTAPFCELAFKGWLSIVLLNAFETWSSPWVVIIIWALRP